MRTRRIGLKLFCYITCVSVANKLGGKLRRVVVSSKDRKHIIGITIPVAVDSLKGFSGP
jgi:hypothetical protein